ncbi:MAG: electron transport complex subunit RsxC [Clostridia bacterium]|nr:electron transport complex subunit RsxC [Clostridia bacterium]
MPAPDQVILSMAQHIGPPCKPTVKVGDAVAVGQVVGDSDQLFAAPVHASVSGTVSALTEITMPNGSKAAAVVIDSDGEMRPFEGLTPPEVNNHAQFLAAVRASGLVGLGGAGFPTHVKLNPKNLQAIDTLIINADECEPYITADYRECIENSWDVISGVQTIMEFLDTAQVIIAIEANKPKAIEELSRIAEKVTTEERKVMVKKLPAFYPQGAEKVLIAQTTGRKVPPGKLPADVGCVVMNVTTIAALSRFLKTGMPLVEKRVTIDGSAVKEPKNVIVPLGTPIEKVIEFAGGLQCPAEKVLMGGPMMGTALVDRSLPILKQNNAILALSREDAALPEASACIRCGKCVAACPMNLVPPTLAIAQQLGDVDTLNKRGIMTCMECGCCAFSCPAFRPLVQIMRLGKDLVRAASKKS